MLDFGKGDSINQALAPGVGGWGGGGGPWNRPNATEGVPPCDRPIQVGGGSPLAKYGQGGGPPRYRPNATEGGPPCDRPNMSNRQILAYMPPSPGELEGFDQTPLTP